MPATVNGLPTLGTEVGPTLVSHMTQRGGSKTWELPDWAIFHDLPYYSLAKKSSWWQASYQGNHYGLSSGSASGERVQVMGHWEREVSNGSTLKQGTLLFDFGANGHRLANDNPGSDFRYGKISCLQHKNKLLIAANAWNTNLLQQKVAADGGLRSLSGAVALYFHGIEWPTKVVVSDPERDIPLFSDTDLPFTLGDGDTLLVRDGLTFICIRPLADTRCTFSRGERETFNGVTYQVPLLLTCYLLEQPAATVTDYGALERLGCVAFAVELSDETEEAWGAFRSRVADAHWSVTASSGAAALAYGSGNDYLAGVYPFASQDRKFAGPVINGQPAYPADLDRETDTCVQSRTGSLTKNGCTLTFTKGRQGYLLVKGQNLLAMTPDPEPTPFRLEMPYGVVLSSPGPVTCCRAVLTNGTLSVETAANSEDFVVENVPGVTSVKAGRSVRIW